MTSVCCMQVDKYFGVMMGGWMDQEGSGMTSRNGGERE